MKHEFPRISRTRLKVIDENIVEFGDGTTPSPTEEERAWIDIMKASDPERERLRKKISVCAISDVVEYNNDFVTIMYDGIKYTIKKPISGFRVAKAREVSVMDALDELNSQRQIFVGAVPLARDFSNVDAEVVHLLSRVAESFFFTPYL